MVGAGVVGLSCAWHLQRHGVDVTVVDRHGVAAGASHGNAGYIAPLLATPLPEPAVLRYALRAVLDPRSPVRIPLSASRSTLRFLLRFVRNATWRRWEAGVGALASLNERTQTAFDELVDAGVEVSLHDAPILAVFEHPGQAAGMLEEVARIVAAGRRADIEPMSGDEARRLEPLVGQRSSVAIAIHGQRRLDPAAFTAALAASVRRRGGLIQTGPSVMSVARHAGRAVVHTSAGELAADTVVLAAGAWLPRLAAPHGVRMPMQAGRGYSFVVDADPVPRHPIYVPAARSASTPAPGGIRITGLMDLDRPDDPLRPTRVRAIQRSVAFALPGVDWASRRLEWVGPRPLTADGLPLIGPTRTPGVFVAGGHGMWGLTHAPITGRLLADSIATGGLDPALRPYDPCR